MPERASDTDPEAAELAPRLTAEQKRQGRWLLRAWGVMAAVYVVLAALWSVGPIRTALAAPPGEAVSDAPSRSWTRGPPGIILRQAGVTFVPPLLVLWFGWDAWFALAGFLGPRRARPRKPPQAP